MTIVRSSRCLITPSWALDAETRRLRTLRHIAVLVIEDDAAFPGSSSLRPLTRTLPHAPTTVEALRGTPQTRQFPNRRSAPSLPLNASAPSGCSFRPRGRVAFGRADRRPGSPLNVPPIPASNFVLREHRAYSRDDGTPGWESLGAIVGGLEGGISVAFASGMSGIAAIFDQLHAGSVVALPDDCYQGVTGLAQAGQRHLGRSSLGRRRGLTPTAAGLLILP